MINVNEWRIKCENCGEDIKVKDFEEHFVGLVCPNCEKVYELKIVPKNHS